jgi:hypothetical protein
MNTKITSRLATLLKSPAIYACLFAFFLNGSCNAQNGNNDILKITNGYTELDVNPGTFSIMLFDKKGTGYVVSAASTRRDISDLKKDTSYISWKFPLQRIAVFLQLHKEYLDVNIKADSSATFTWPLVQGKLGAFTIPFYQGKYIPANDTVWLNYLSHAGAFSGSQDLSMQFFAADFSDKALVYIIKNMFDNEFEFYKNDKRLSLKFNHQFPKTAKEREYGFRIYLTDNTPLVISKTYKKYVEETKGIVTLEEKAGDNPNIRKLYGAPHIYIWNTEFIASGDIQNWKLFKNTIIKQLQANVMNPTRHIFNLFAENDAAAGKEFLGQMNEFKKDAFVIKYHKNLLARALSEALIRKDFYSADAWKNIKLPPEAIGLINKGIDSLDAMQLYTLNKMLFTVAYPGVALPAREWGGTPPSMLEEMKAAGIKKAWLGLNDWLPGEMHPELVTAAKKEGYLIGAYDSYHSMHPPGNERWITAKFDDTTLYTRAFVMNKAGKPVGGFLGQGRKLNPIMSMPAVEHRMSKVMKNSENEFNSWFIDCDATGEIYNDYTPGRMTDQQQDMEARLKRMAWIRDTYKLVIGSEVGNDFAEATIAFGHGMTTPVIAWSDPDMRKNKASPYYVGSYFSNNGGIPDRYSLQAPVKDKYHYIYFDNRFNVPLFQLVYNNAVITSHHWEWNSLKVPGEIKTTELKEILYNIPPLYHIDKENWDKFKNIIEKHVNVFSKTHEMAVRLEMTEFDWLTKDHLVQRTKFGNELEIIANFGNVDFIFDGKKISGKSLIIHDLKANQYENYTP